MKLTTGLLVVLLLTGAGTLAGAELRGLLVLGHEVRSLQPCGDTRVFWLHAPGALHQQLQADYRRLAKQPYEPLYVEIEGAFSEHPVSAFAADYDGTIVVSEVRSVSRDGIEACGAGQPASAPEPPAAAAAATYVFVCDEQTAYTVRVSGAEAWVFHPRGTLMLSAVLTSQGTKYSDGSFELWIDGQQAQLGESSSELQGCRNDPRRAVWEKAKLDGADFRAVGNEPGWNLEILEGSRIVLIADYGASRVERPLPQPMIDQGARTTRWDAGELIVEVIGRPCRDSMSGESFEATVVVTWGKQTLKGCGRALH
jgi:putative lipoprotein